MPARDDFTQDTKHRLGARAAWRCSRPDCRRATIGPKLGDARDYMTAGEAAHITAASPRGPRYDETLTPEQRKDIENGIWLCSNCADVIDKDYRNYSVATLRQWRELAERAAHQAMVAGSAGATTEPTTLVGFGFGIVAEAVWTAGSRERWGFGIRRFVRGDEVALHTYFDGTEPNISRMPRFVTVESQGDGRVFAGTPSWERPIGNSGFHLEVSLPIVPRSPRADPNELGTDLALIDGDLALDDGAASLVRGIENAKQHVLTALWQPYGEWQLHPHYGSCWRDLAIAHDKDRPLLERLLLLDLARLVSVPIGSTDFEQHGTQVVKVERMAAPLAFVERVESVRVLDLDWHERVLRASLALRWGTAGTRWEGEFAIPLPEPAGPAASTTSPWAGVDMGPSRRV